jgi:SAM-dependent methyltransferase
MKDQKYDKQIDERKIWLKSLTKFVKPGKIAEFGCGSGFVLEELAVDFPESIIIGVDINRERLKTVVEKGFGNVITLQADITKETFSDNTFDTAIIVAVLHEVYSKSGKGKVEELFQVVNKALKENGVLIVQDFLKPSSREVEIRIKNKEIQNNFIRFANEFRQRKIRFEKIEDRMRLDIADAIEFISKYRSPSEDDWKEEMNETHFGLAENEFKEMAINANFQIKSCTHLPKRRDWWVEVKEDIDFDFEDEYKWIQLVLTKNSRIDAIGE